MEALRVNNLYKNFGGVQAAHNISFSVAAGERLAIIGPNGAGKTTLFNLLNGQLSPSAGQVLFFGKDITHKTVFQRTHLGLARSFQITNLFLELTVLKNVLLALHGVERSRFQVFRPITFYDQHLDKAKDLLDLIDLWNKKDDRVQSISYGEQRKLEIALCLASKPKLILMDEPSNGLTNVESAEIACRIRDLGREVTVILVAHDMDLVFEVAERILVLHNGRIIAQGMPQEIQSDPRVREIYMGSNDMIVECLN